MNTQLRQTNDAIKAVRKTVLKAMETVSNKVLAIFPLAESDPPTARLALNIVATQAHEALDLFVRQFAQALDSSLGDAWLTRACSEIDSFVSEMEAGK